MLELNIVRMTSRLSYGIFIFILAFILLLLGIAEIVLQDRVHHAFKNYLIQYPGSSLAEWLFVTLNPLNLDTGPSSAKFTVGAVSMFSALLAMAWMATVWWSRRKVGYA